ncbi:MAG TPA: hypothetical protein VGR57_15980 [Ktedonobacterales bacterium]|nr:hypothetical protein [Ktedonobacterales bacterium]
MNPSTNPPSPEPTRVEIVYALTPEQQQMQSRVQKRVQGMSRFMGVFFLFFLLAFVVAVGGIVFVVVQIASHVH